MLILFLAAVMSIILHEYALAAAAVYLGDYTAKSARRLTLNPLRHVDLLGTLLVPLLLMLIRLPAIGWARPVPFNYYNLRSPQKDALWIAVAGSLANLACACVASILNRVITLPWLNDVFSYIGIVNIILGLGNLLPIPLLDGWKLITKLAPFTVSKKLEQAEAYGFCIMGVGILLGIVNRLILPFSMSVSSVLGFRQLF
jgi:Zn-dependent protease